MKVGIVGHEAAKFSPRAERRARAVIRAILRDATQMISGGCHLGGVDIWAEEEAERLGIPTHIFKPRRLGWLGGYRDRNVKIARHADIVHVVVVDRLPRAFLGLHHSECYHCHSGSHVKSGGCWTGHYARRTLNKDAVWHTIRQGNNP